MRTAASLVGERFGDLEVLSRAENDPTNKVAWNCKCKCGTLTVAVGLNLKTGNTKSCGCWRNKPQRMDISGKVYGRLTAIEVAKVCDHKVWWRCSCECGQMTNVMLGKLQSGSTKSCGCMQREISTGIARKHLAGKKKQDHPRWNPSLSPTERDKFRPSELKEWSRRVLERDDFTCQVCGSRGVSLHAHHLAPYKSHRDLRTNVENGTTVCQPCHTCFHREWGYTKFTREDFEMFRVCSLASRS